MEHCKLCGQPIKEEGEPLTFGFMASAAISMGLIVGWGYFLTQVIGFNPTLTGMHAFFMELGLGLFISIFAVAFIGIILLASIIIPWVVLTFTIHNKLWKKAMTWRKT